MARPIRIEYEGAFYHVTAQGNHRCKISIYLLKQYTAASNRETGAMLGDMSDFAVAKAYQLIVKEMNTESTLSEKVERLDQKMSRVGG